MAPQLFSAFILAALFWIAAFLMTIPLIFGLLWQVAYIEQRTAPVWLMRAALAVANDDERAYIYTMMTELALSEGRNEPITCGTVFDLIKQRDQQIEALGLHFPISREEAG
jgi:hypothetical protein